MPRVSKSQIQAMKRAIGTAKPKGLTKRQTRAVRKVASTVIHQKAETKTVGAIKENLQLYHNKPTYFGGLLQTSQGDADPDNYSTFEARDGDKIALTNVNVRLWLSNKLDRPNVMYKCYLFWYDDKAVLNDALVFFTQTNKMLDRINNEQIGIIDQKTIFSKEMYLNGTEKFEHSQLCTLNGNWKGKKIVYDNGATMPSHKNIGFCVVCYDAYGTLQTDNIASFAFNYACRFKDL